MGGSKPAETDQSRLIEVIGAVGAVLVLAAGVAIPAGVGPEQNVQLVLSIFLFTILLWLTKPVPLEISSVLAPVLLYAFGLVTTFQEAVIGFASTLVFFLFLLLLLGASVANVGLDERAAGRLLSATSTPQQSVKSLGKAIFVLSFIMPSAVARAVTFIPVVRRIRERYGLSADSAFEYSSFLVLGHVNPIASMALMTGGGMAIITSQVISSSIRKITWVEWAVYMIPPVTLLYALSALTAERFYAVDDETVVGDVPSTAAEGGKRGADERMNADEEVIDPTVRGQDKQLDRDQWIVLTVIVGAVVAWIVGSFVGTPTILPAALAVAILSLPGVDIITAEDIKEVSWGILFVIGAMFSLLEVMDETEALEFIVDVLAALIPFASLNAWQTVGALLVLAMAIRIMFSTASAAIVVALPIVLEFGRVFGVDLLYLSLSVMITIGATTFLPFNTTSVLVSFDRGPLDVQDVFRFGLVTMLYALVVIVLSWLFYWPLVD